MFFVSLQDVGQVNFSVAESQAVIGQYVEIKIGEIPDVLSL